MDRSLLLAPALFLFAVFVAAFVAYCALHLLGRRPAGPLKHNELFGPFLAGFLVWLLGPLERRLIGRVSPNAITAVSLALCVLTGLAAGMGHLAAAVWLYAFGGILDVLDGRLARRAGTPSASGALFDSVSDRWGELVVFAGYAWYLRTTPWLLAVMAASAGSMMVSYTRARAEGLGVSVSRGWMQRAERIVLVAGGTLVAAWYVAEPAHAPLAAPVLGGTMLLCGAGSIATALHRWLVAHRALAGRPLEVPARAAVTPSPSPGPVARVRATPAPERPVPRAVKRPSPAATGR